MFEDVQYNGTVYVNDESDNDWVRIGEYFIEQFKIINSFILSDPSFIQLGVCLIHNVWSRIFDIFLLF